MSPTKVRPMGGPGEHRPAPPLAHCTPLFSLAAGAAGAPVRRASGAAAGGDPRAAGGTCSPEAGVAPCRPSRHTARGTDTNELHPRPGTMRRGLRSAPRAYAGRSHATQTTPPAREASGKEEDS
jgi:hypothetical protein